MDKRERLQLGLRIDAVQDWVNQNLKATAGRDNLRDGAQTAARKLLGRVATISFPTDAHEPFAVLPLMGDDTVALGALARYVRLPQVSPDDAEAVSQLVAEVPDALREARTVVEGGGMFRKNTLTEDQQDAADFISEYYEWGRDGDLAGAIARTAVPEETDLVDAPMPPPTTGGMMAQMMGAATPKVLHVPLDQALTPAVGLAAMLAKYGTPSFAADPSVFADLAETLKSLRSNTSYGDSIDGALVKVDALEPFAALIPPTTEAVIVCAPKGRDASELLDHLRFG